MKRMTRKATCILRYFSREPGAPLGTAVLYRGGYIRGSNRAIYYGDMSSVMGNGLIVDSSAGWNYVGGSMFSKEILGILSGE
ncbi:MAG: hypothetical protein NTV34_10095 [Proteobacteria bacterium]|nr:hypothetical protein [Pseudomonadota bacterium]